MLKTVRALVSVGASLSQGTELQVSSCCRLPPVLDWPLTECLSHRRQWTDAQLFLALSLLPAGLQMDILRPRTASDGSTSNFLAADPRAVEHAESLLASFRSKRNLIDLLPAELLITIGRLAVELTGSSDVALCLAAVSQRWRAIFCEDARIWEYVSLDGLPQDRAMAKLETLCAYGTPRHLLARLPLRLSTHRLLDAIESKASGLKSLVLDLPELSPRKTWTLIRECSRLESLSMCLPDRLDPHISPPPWAPAMSSLRRIRFTHWTDQLSLADRSSHRPACFHWLPTSFPNLEELIVDDPRVVLARANGRTFKHESLRVLRIHRGSGQVEPSTQAMFILPNLETLDLAGSFPESYIPYLFPPSLPPNTDHLTHLAFRPGFFHEIVLIDHLPHLAALTHLDIRGGTTLRLLLKALTHPPAGQPGRRLCPKLVQLDLDDEIPQQTDPEDFDSLGQLITLRREDARQVIESRAGAVRLAVRGWKWHDTGPILLWEELGDEPSQPADLTEEEDVAS